MIIPNTVIKLDYDPVRDVLLVEWPDLHVYSMGEADYILNKISETVKIYDVRFLLIDTRKSLTDVPEVLYRRVISKFLLNLASTRIKMLARVVKHDATGEEVITEVAKEVQFTIPIKSFVNTEEALRWFTPGGYPVYMNYK